MSSEPHDGPTLVPLRPRVDAWAAAGIITAEQADRIVAHEHATGGSAVDASAPPDSNAVTTPPTAPMPARTTTGAEAIGYVGAALALGALSLLFGEVWNDLFDWARLALIATLTLAVVAGGWVLRGSSPAMRRLVSVLWTAGVAGVAWFTATLASHVLDLDTAVVAVVAAAAAFVTAAVLYTRHTRALLQLALAVTLVVTLTTALNLPPMRPEPVWFGLVIAAVGVAWTIAAWGGALRPVMLAEIVGAGLVLVGAQVASFTTTRTAALAIGVLAAAAVVALAVRADQLHRLVVGALGLFVLVPQLVFEWFGDVIGGPATLLLVGVLLVLLAVGLGRARREVTSGRRTETGGEAV
ncbi:MAG: DUF2157 domain-containing protein [Nitriliruptoraceae bacterium]